MASGSGSPGEADRGSTDGDGETEDALSRGDPSGAGGAVRLIDADAGTEGREDHDQRGHRRGGIRAARGARDAVCQRGPATGGHDLTSKENMAKVSQRVRQQRTPKYKTRGYTRCRRCGRARAVYRKFGVCRICLRELAHDGYVPGMTKSSW